jgi:hypothetical protein
MKLFKISDIFTPLPTPALLSHRNRFHKYLTLSFSFQKHKKTVSLTVFFALMGSSRVKAFGKILEKLTLDIYVFLPKVIFHTFRSHAESSKIWVFDIENEPNLLYIVEKGSDYVTDKIFVHKGHVVTVPSW